MGSMKRAIRKTYEKKLKNIIVRLCEQEHTYIKTICVERQTTITKFVLEAVRHYIKYSS